MTSKILSSRPSQSGNAFHEKLVDLCGCRTISLSQFAQTGGATAVDWRKVLLVLFMIFELGPYLESLWNGLTSEPIRCGVKEFFHPNN